MTSPDTNTIIGTALVLLLSACNGDMPYGIPPGYDAAQVAEYRKCYAYNLSFDALGVFAAIDGCGGTTPQKAACVCRHMMYDDYLNNLDGPGPTRLEFELGAK